MGLPQAELKRLKRLQQKKFRQEEGLVVIEGVRMVGEAVLSHAEILDLYYTRDVGATPAGGAILKKLSGKAVRMVPVSARDIAAFTETVHAQGIAAVIRFPTVPPESLFGRRGPSALLVALDAVSDPGNLGSIVRTCDWFGVSGLALGRNSVELLNPKVVRGSMGSIFHLPVAVDVDLRQALRDARGAGFTVYVTDLQGEASFDEVRYSARSVVVFGNEAWGVSDEILGMADARLSIRRFGAAESLNVGVACGVVLSAVRRAGHD
jgi:RNA methyltransferase, TrmH family